MLRFYGIVTNSDDADVQMNDEEGENGGEAPEHEVLIRCTQGDNKFSARVSILPCKASTS